jgi:hypothetical protein
MNNGEGCEIGKKRSPCAAHFIERLGPPRVGAALLDALSHDRAVLLAEVEAVPESVKLKFSVKVSGLSV